MKSGNTIFWSKQSTNTAFAPEISGKHLEMTRKEIKVLTRILDLQWEEDLKK